eukprot:TRINITY_DN40434_c0_g1_i1.p1 TRINITY_DN40434_c0_g1~~TRINITY_DN40434_c0_g1_i1.p1  ORF type:complete len:175 (+),score=44.90 TRINITY_DN40434_c0_g1_i1:117-641(+)
MCDEEKEEKKLLLMEQALKVAERGLSCGEVPVGCVIIWKGNVVSEGHNETNASKDATRHAELVAIDRLIQSGVTEMSGFAWNDVDIVVTCEPCIMCAAALRDLNVRSIMFGCSNPRFGGCGSVHSIIDPNDVHHHPHVLSGILSDECIRAFMAFYERENLNVPPEKRKKRKKIG